MPRNDLLSLRSGSCLLDSSNIQRPVLPVEAANTTHIITIVGKLFSSETIFRCVREHVCGIWKTMEILALPTIRTATAGKEKADVFIASCVGAGEARVKFDLAASLRFCFTEIVC